MAKAMLAKIKERLVLWEMLVLVPAFLIYLGFMIHSQWQGEITKAQWLQSGAVLLLVLVTAIYVERTGRIAAYTKQQTEEMMEQRQSSLVPVLVAVDRLKSIHVIGDGVSGGQIVSSLDVYLENIGPGPALDIGVTVVDANPNVIEAAWKDGKTAYISTRATGNLSELASGQNTGSGQPPVPDISIGKDMKFVVVAECNDTYRNIIGAYREFRVVETEGGNLKIESTKTISAQRINYRIRSYP